MAKPKNGGVLNTCEECGTSWRRPGAGRRRKVCAACTVASMLRSCLSCSASWSWLGRGRGPTYCSDNCIPECAVAGCGRVSKYNTAHGRLCPMHYVRARTHGDPHAEVRAHDASTPPATCRQCGGPRGDGYAKWFCTPRCYGRYYREVDETRVWSCLDCGDEMSSSTSRVDATRCRRCSKVRPPLSSRQLAARDGTTCGVCAEPVDMGLSGRDRFGPAADHVVPRAKGGANTAENLQLAHARCNAVKRDELALTSEWIAVLAADARAAASHTDRAVVAAACGAGHPRTPANGSWGRKGWTCRVCKVARQRQRRQTAKSVSAMN